MVNFAAGGIATPADAALMMQLGVDGVFVGSGIFKSEDPAARPRPSSGPPPTSATRPSIAEVSKGLGGAMPGLEVSTMPQGERLATRGW